MLDSYAVTFLHYEIITNGSRLQERETMRLYSNKAHYRGVREVLLTSIQRYKGNEKKKKKLKSENCIAMRDEVK